MGPIVQAQQPQQAQPAQLTAADATLAAQLRAAVTSDTTAFAVGHTDFQRYTTPDYCLAAVQHAITIGRRSIAAQKALATVRQQPARDTLPARVAAVAHACAARFPVATTPAADLPDLFALALTAGDDSLAQAVLARQLSLAKSPSTQAALLLDAAQRDLAASPARVTAAEAVLTRLDALGSGAAVLPSRIQAHLRLMQLGDSTGDDARVRRAAAQVLTLVRMLPADSLRRANAYTWALSTVYQALGRVAYVRAPDSLVVLARQLQQDAQRIPGLTTGAGRRYATLPLDTLVQLISPVGEMAGAGQPTPVLHADFWVPAKDTVQPAPGQVSLFVPVSADCYDSYASYGSPGVLDPIRSGCQRVYDFIRQLHAQYGAKVTITAVAAVADHGGMLLSAPEPPAEAVKALQWYVFDYLKLPVQHLAVQVLPTTSPLPAPDGRIFAQPLRPPTGDWSPQDWWEALGGNSPLFQQVYPAAYAYRARDEPVVVLTGPDGRLAYGGGASVVFDQLLARMLATPTPSPAPTTPAASSPSAVHPQQPGF